ncbi:MAG: hypothetical protein KAY32_00850 [Candidatus Eisenbacteria sp.]|nr:hypothetical protein [Candidatus Eisenbacteria bacterium]
MNQRGGTGILGLLAVFAATAIVLTVVMLFATGVAQRTLIPRLQQRAANAVSAPVSAPAPEAAVAPLFDTGAVAVDSLRIVRRQLSLEEGRIAAQTAALRELLDQWAARRAEADAETAQRIASLAKVYSNMKPEAAARVMVRLDDEVFEQVFRQLDKRQAGKVLALIDPERVARMTRRVASAAVSARVGDGGQEAR